MGRITPLGGGSHRVNTSDKNVYAILSDEGARVYAPSVTRDEGVISIACVKMLLPDETIYELIETLNTYINE
jgi:hypothetical protein